jgi:hypothetical protein
MNCKNCNSPLEPQGRFCPLCGTPAEGNSMVSGANRTSPVASMQNRPIEAESTLITPQQSMLPLMNPQSLSQQPQQMDQIGLSQSGGYAQPGAPMPYSQQPSPFYPPQNQPLPSAPTESLLPQDLNQIARGSQTPAGAMNVQKSRRRRRPSFLGCFSVIIAVLILLFASLAGTWFLFLRPYVHGIVEQKLDETMTKAVNQIPSLPPQPPLPFNPPPITLSVGESGLENLIKLNIAPSDPVQDPVVHINQQGVRLEFNAHVDFLPMSFPCAVSFLPALDNQNNLVAQNVNIEGIVNQVISPDEMTTLLNQHFSAAVQKINHPISSINLQQGEMDVTFNN